MRDPAIKLFGQTIQTPVYSSPGPILPPSFSPPFIHHQLLDDGNNNNNNKDLTDKPVNDTNEDDGVQSTLLKEGSKVPSETPAGNGELESDDLDSEEGKQPDMNSPQEKTLKKPDKLLPCPRCNSMDTKFCYYNNYNLSQPRHFCKSCQRYWTDGGSMRNVPVGAGRRKSKYSAPHYQHFAVSEALQSARMDQPGASHHGALKTNGTVLTFGYDKHLCESVAPVMNICGKAMMNGSQSGTPRSEELRMGDNRDDHSSGSSITVANAKDEVGEPELQNPVLQNCHSFPPQFACYPGAPWPYPWNAGQWNSPVPQMVQPGFCPPGFPMAFYPTAPNWGFVPVQGTWNVQWVTPESISPNHAPPTKGLSTTKLGKHHRDENLPKSTESLDEDSSKESNPEKSLWVPKTLRIDDPGEAAKSSIWATLGIQNERAHIVSGGDLFKAFNSKVNKKSQVFNPSAVLQANPAAMCRSQSFHESA